MKKLLLHPSLKPLLMLTIVIVTVVSGFQLHSLMNYREDVSHIELTEEKLQEISKPVPNQIVLNFSPGTTKVQRDEYITSIGGTISSESDALNSAVVNLPETIAIADLPKSDFVAAPEENYFVMALENPVNDPEYGNQWSLPVIKAPELWNTGTQDEKVVAVIDSGICDQHPDLQGRIVSGYDFIEGDTSPFDDNGHGCSVSGIIAANINDGIGIAGVGKNVKIMPLKVLDSLGIGTYSNVANAIVYAVDHGADIINLSLGGTNPSSILSNAISYAETNNVIVVAAAGNTGTEGVLYPAGYPYVISVGSTNEQLQQSTFSSYGPGVDILAPGERILTTGLDNSYRYVSGTSYSAPVVSGILTMKSVSELDLNEGNVLGSFEEDNSEGTVNATAAACVNAPFVIPTNGIRGWVWNNPQPFATFTGDYTHDGLDIKQTSGTNGVEPIYAVHDGILRLKPTADQAKVTNLSIEVNIPNTYQVPQHHVYVYYAHMGNSDGTISYIQPELLAIGSGSINVKKGQFLGYQGNTKNPPTHLHLSINTSNSELTHIDPSPYFGDNLNYNNGAREGGEPIRCSLSALNRCEISDSHAATVYKELGCNSDSISVSYSEAFGGVGASWRNLKDHSPSGFEDNLKSIKITSGYSVRLYQNYENYGDEGFSVCLNNSQSNLNNITFDNSTLKVGENASSFKVFAGRDCITQTSCSTTQGTISDQACSPGTPGDGGSTNQGDSSDFITDVTIADKTVMGLNSSFTKIWRLKNNGTSTWNSGYKLAFQSGYRLGAPSEVSLNQTVSPGGTLDISVNMVAPNVGGTYKGYWKLKNSGGQLFGDQVWVEIVAQSGASTPTNTGSGQVKLYANTNYANQLGAYGVGDTNHPSANSFSIDIPSGWSVKAYSSDNYSGQEVCLYQSKANLTDITWNLKIQSMRVYNFMACGDANARVRLFANANFDSEVGNYGAGPTQQPNNNSKSMEVPAGWSVKTYRGNNYDGGDRCWNSSVSDLQSHESWHYDIDSIDVFPTNVCPETQADEIRLFAETGHKGAQHVASADIPNLAATAIGNDNLRSIKVGYDWRMVIFEHTDYQGNSRVITGDDNDTGEYWNYGISSLKVYKQSPNLVELFTLNNYGGDKFSVDRSIDNLIHWGWKHRPESIVVKEGYEAIVCTGENFFGNCGRTKTKHVDINEVIYGVRHNVGSIQVCKTQCPAGAAVPAQVSPLDGVRYFPGSTVTLVANSDGLKYLFEISGGGQPTWYSGWTSSSAFTTEILPASSNSYTWRAKSWNQYGESGWSAPSTFYVIDTPISGVDISGPSTAEINTTLSFTADSNPVDASNVTYNWTPTPISGQNTNTATYNFNTPGTRSISVTASNSAGNVVASKQVNIGCPQGSYIVELYGDNSLTQLDSTTCDTEINEQWGSSGPLNTTLPDLNVELGQTVTLNNTRSKLTSPANAGAQSITLANVSGFSNGDEVLIIEMLGTDTGKYEKKKISSISANTLNLRNTLINSYNIAQIVKIEKFKDITVNGTLTSPEWDGETGGILIFDATGNLTVNGTVNVTGKGYRGGSTRTENNPDRGHTGEGHLGNYNSVLMDCWGTANNSGNGGGSGHGFLFEWQHERAATGAGGGGHRTGGGVGHGPSGEGWCNGTGGSFVGDDQLTKIFFGGGGGSGGAGKSGHEDGGYGGDGGGIVMINAEQVTLNGIIESNGYPGREVVGSSIHKGAGGGGGAGGTIALKAKVVNIGTDKLFTQPGPGGASSNEGSGGGWGGYGRIKVEYCNSISGTKADSVVVQSNCDIDNFSARYTKTQTFTAGSYKFSTKADDGVKVWVDDELIINEWTSGYKEKDVTKTIATGNHNIKVEYMELTGDAKVNFEITEIVAPPIVTDIFTGEYFNNKTLSGTPVITNTTQVIDYGWNGSPGTGIGSDNFSVKWTGDFNFPTGGDYTFTGQGDDGIRLYVDDVLVFNGWVDQGFTKYQGVANLTAGIHKIRYDYYEAGGGAAVTLTWVAGATICTTNNEEFCAKYYNSQTPANGSVLARRETGPIDYNWGEGSPAPEVRNQDFSGKWTGKFTFNAGTYNFTHTADDGIRAWIDNVLFIDRWNGQSYSEVVTAKTMTAGLHEIRVEYLEWGGGARVKFIWEQDGTPTNTAPVASQIPGQTINQGQTFTTINLANYVTDTAGDTITWSYAGNTNLTVSIANNIATVTAPANWTGTNNIVFRATDSGGLFAESTAAFVVNAVVAGCQQNQFSSKYFNNMTLTGTAIDKGCINNIAFDWAGGSPSGVNTDSFSARYEGNYTFDAGTYTFTTLSDNGVRLYVDGILKIDQWVSHSPQTDTVDVQLTAGSHAIKLEYFENQYSAKISLSWNLKTTTTGTELLSAPWDVVDEDGGSEERYQAISSSVLAGKTTLRITYDLNGLTALPGDASAIIFDQDGWKYISLSNYGVNGLDGIQTVDIPLSAFTGLNLTTGSTMIHTRFWYETGFDVDILSIKVL